MPPGRPTAAALPRCPAIVRRSASGRTSSWRNSPTPRSWRRSIPICATRCTAAQRPAVLGHAWCSRRSRAPDYERALDAGAARRPSTGRSGRGRVPASRARFCPSDAGRGCATCSRSSARLRRLRGADRRSPRPLRARAVAAARAGSCSRADRGPAQRSRTGLAAARSRAAAARGRIQHVLRRTAVHGRRARRGRASRRCSSGSIARRSRASASGSGSRRCRRATATFVELWDRGLRAREEGRPGPFVRTARAQPAPARRRRGPVIVCCHVATFTDRRSRWTASKQLYEALVDARREAGGEPVPFHRFAAAREGRR